MASRYAKSEVLTRREPSGRLVQYLAPRILPQGSTVAGTTATPVAAAERHRLDLIAKRTLHDPEQAWRIADANDAMDPFALCAHPGTLLRLPAPPQ